MHHVQVWAPYLIQDPFSTNLPASIVGSAGRKSRKESYGAAVRKILQNVKQWLKYFSFNPEKHSVEIYGEAINAIFSTVFI